MFVGPRNNLPYTVGYDPRGCFSNGNKAPGTQGLPGALFTKWSVISNNKIVNLKLIYVTDTTIFVPGWQKILQEIHLYNFCKYALCFRWKFHAPKFMHATFQTRQCQ